MHDGKPQLVHERHLGVVSPGPDPTPGGRINAETLQQLRPASVAAAAASPAPAGADAAAEPVTHEATAPASGARGGGAWPSHALNPFLPFDQHPPLPPAAYPTAHDYVTLVAGPRVSGTEPPARSAARRAGQRSKDHCPRAKRRCKKCVEAGRTDEEARNCPGKSGRGTCGAHPRAPAQHLC